MPTLATIVFLVAAAIALPGGPPVGMDYLAYDPGTDRVWVPAGTPGRSTSSTSHRQGHHDRGFATASPGRPGRPRRAPARRPSATASSTRKPRRQPALRVRRHRSWRRASASSRRCRTGSLMSTATRSCGYDPGRQVVTIVERRAQRPPCVATIARRRTRGLRGRRRARALLHEPRGQGPHAGHRHQDTQGRQQLAAGVRCRRAARPRARPRARLALRGLHRRRSDRGFRARRKDARPPRDRRRCRQPRLRSRAGSCCSWRPAQQAR